MKNVIIKSNKMSNINQEEFNKARFDMQKIHPTNSLLLISQSIPYLINREDAQKEIIKLQEGSESYKYLSEIIDYCNQNIINILRLAPLK